MIKSLNRQCKRTLNLRVCSCPIFPQLQSSVRLRLRALPVQTECAVHIKLAGQAVACCAQGNGQHNTERDQLRWDLLQGAYALRDGMGCADVLANCTSLAAFADVVWRISGGEEERAYQTAIPSVNSVSGCLLWIAAMSTYRHWHHGPAARPEAPRRLSTEHAHGWLCAQHGRRHTC